MHPYLVHQHLDEHRRDLVRLAGRGSEAPTSPPSIASDGASSRSAGRVYAAPAASHPGLRVVRPAHRRGPAAVLGGLLIRAGTRLGGGETAQLSPGR